MSNHCRKQYFVDSHLQGELLRRSIMYWCWCLMSVFVAVACWRMLFGPPLPFPEYFVELWERFSPILIASLLLLPLIVFDVMRTSNRIAGPMMRLREAIRMAGTGAESRPLRFRNADFLEDVAGEFNEMLDRFEKRSSRLQAIEPDSPLIDVAG